MAFSRRRFVSLLLRSLAAAMLPLSQAIVAGDRRSAVYLIPGYHPERAGNLPSQVPDSYKGERRMVTRIDAAGKVDRMLMPCRGHQIVVAPDRSLAVFCPLDEPYTAVFDPISLKLMHLLPSHAPGFIGGGHGLFSSDGGYFIGLERAAYAPYAGSPSNHYGRIVVRDAASMAIVSVHSCFGIGPHEIAVINEGRHAVVANYGSTDWPDTNPQPGSYLVEPSVTLVDLSDGKLLAKYVPRNPEYEIRHLKAVSNERIFAIQVGETTRDQAAFLMRDMGNSPPVDLNQDATATPGMAFTPAPLLGLQLAHGRWMDNTVLNSNQLLNRQGQSLLYDARHDEVLTTFASSHALQISSGGGEVKRTLMTDQLGLHYPRGIALHPDGRHYVVSGSWRNLYVFERGTHKLNRDLCRYETFYDHSHLTVI